MAKKPVKKKSPAKSKDLPPLTALGQRIVSYLLTSIALGDYGDCCSVEDMAAHFGRAPGPFKRMIQKLVDEGYVTISGEVLEMVYPTVAAIRQQDPHLSERQAKTILRKLGRGRRRGT